MISGPLLVNTARLRRIVGWVKRSSHPTNPFQGLGFVTKDPTYIKFDLELIRAVLPSGLGYAPLR